MHENSRIFFYILEVSIPLIITASIWVALKVSFMAKEIERLLEMHEHPETTGFGTIGMKDELKQINSGIRALVHYMKWLAKEQTGKIPPPSVYHENGDSDL